MKKIINIIIGGIVTIIIGGVSYNVSKSDIVKNFAINTGMNQGQAEQYINTIPENELVSWKEIGQELIDDGNYIINLIDEKIDCINYKYDWETSTFSCFEAKSQLEKTSKDEISLGQSYIKLDSDSASKDDIKETVRLIQQVVSDYQFEIFDTLGDTLDIDGLIKTCLYNKSVLEAVLESN